MSPPDDILPGLAPIEAVLGRSDRAVVTLSGVRAYPVGFSLSIIAALRDGDMRGDPFGMYVHFRSPQTGQPEPPPDLLRVQITYSDGATSPLGLSPLEGEPSRLTVRSQGGGGGRRRHRDEFWIAPLPPDGDVSFVTEWVNEGIDLTRIAIDGQLIRDAAQRAVQLWD
jgi:hypothetical protein